MTVGEEFKTIVKKIEQNKAQDNLDKQTVFSFIIRNIGKYEFLTGEDVLPEKDLIEKSDTIKKFQNS